MAALFGATSPVTVASYSTTVAATQSSSSGTLLVAEAVSTPLNCYMLHRYGRMCHKRMTSGGCMLMYVVERSSPRQRITRLCVPDHYTDRDGSSLRLGQ